MRSIAALFVAFSLIALTIAPSDAADAGKTIENLRGDVSYTQTDGGPKTAVAPKASIAAPDSFTAITGPNNSEAGIGLPDSSRVLVGASSSVRLSAFDRAGGTNTANFVVVGKVRFKVEHPAGAHASYTFKAGTAQIAVRGTSGDISWDGSTLQVNCYALTDPALPVQVTLEDGSVFTLSAGQSLIVHFPLSPADPPHVQQVTALLAGAFAEFGLPDNAKELGLAPRSWFASGGWLILIPIAIIVANPHHADQPPTAGTFPIGVSFKITH